MNPLLFVVLSLAFRSAQVQSASVQIAVDASQADHSVSQHVSYKRGEDLEFDSPALTPSGLVSIIQGDVQNAGINLITAGVNLNSDPDKSYFDYSAGPPASLTPDLSGSDTLVQKFVQLRQVFSADQLPVIVQLSGTPSALPLEDLDQDYLFLCNGSGNFYPLPSNGSAMNLVQSAIGSWIDSVNQNISGAIWIGTQEPTHTLGFSTEYREPGQNCSNPDYSEIQSGKTTNIDRFVSYWTPIAQSIRSYNHKLKLGGIQPNSADTADYVDAVEQIVAAGMPLDYLTIQDYSPSLQVVQDVNAAWKQLRSHPAYKSVQVLLDRYGISLQGYNYTSAFGMVQYLIAESQLIQHADMLYGYAVEEAGFHPSTGQSLLPTILKWLQGAPAPLRPFVSSDNDVQGFALVRTSRPESGSIAIWNNVDSSAPENVTLALTGYPKALSSAPENVTLALTGYPKALSSAKVTILKGSGTALLPYDSATITNNSIGGLSLAPNQFFLLSF